MSTHKLLRERIETLHDRYARLQKKVPRRVKELALQELSERIQQLAAVQGIVASLEQIEDIILGLAPKGKLLISDVLLIKQIVHTYQLAVRSVRTGNVDVPFIILLHKQLFVHSGESLAGVIREGGGIRGYEHAKVTNKFEIDTMSHWYVESLVEAPFVVGNELILQILLGALCESVLYPSVLLRHKDVRIHQRAISVYKAVGDVSGTEKMIAQNMLEILHRRLAYMRNLSILDLTDYARQEGMSTQAALNAAKRQTLPAFRVRNIWKIGV